MRTDYRDSLSRAKRRGSVPLPASGGRGKGEGGSEMRDPGSKFEWKPATFEPELPCLTLVAGYRRKDRVFEWLLSVFQIQQVDRGAPNISTLIPPLPPGLAGEGVAPENWIALGFCRGENCGNSKGSIRRNRTPSTEGVGSNISAEAQALPATLHHGPVATGQYPFAFPCFWVACNIRVHDLRAPRMLEVAEAMKGRGLHPVIVVLTQGFQDL